MQGLNREEVHLLILRVYIGLNFIHHFAEKFGLLGVESYESLTRYFSSLHYNDPTFMITLAGICELGACLGFVFGAFTRIAAVGTATYLIASAVAGNHFNLGFTWANPGGGWEFPVFWSVVCLLFLITGGGRVSVDALLRKLLPPWLHFLVR